MASSELSSLDVEPEAGQPDYSETLIKEHRRRPLATSDDVAGLSKWLVKCGCGSCHDLTHPLGMDVNDSDDSDERLYRGESELTSDGSRLYHSESRAKGWCDDPTSVTLEGAATLVGKFTTSKHGDDSEKGKIDSEKRAYATLMERDRHVRRRFGHSNVTTVLLSLRPSPRTSEDSWRTPTELAREVANVTQRTFAKLRRDLDGQYPFEVSYVIAGTQVFATPHSHIVLYLDDPDNAARPSDFSPAVQYGVSRLSTASPDAHSIDDEGDEGAVRIEHDAAIKDVERSGMDVSAVHAHAFEGDDEGDSDEGHVPTPFAATLYAATQLPYMSVLEALKNGYGGRRRRAAMEFGATAWAVRSHSGNSVHLSGGTNFDS